MLDLLVPASLGEGRGITPRVVVESVEVTALVVGAAVHVLGHLEAVALDIGGRVSNGNLAVAARANVLSQITGDGLDVRSSGGGGVVVNDLVAGEEKEKVVYASVRTLYGRSRTSYTHCSRRMRQWWRTSAEDTRRCKIGGGSPGSHG